MAPSRQSRYGGYWPTRLSSVCCNCSRSLLALLRPPAMSAPQSLWERTLTLSNRDCRRALQHLPKQPRAGRQVKGKFLLLTMRGETNPSFAHRMAPCAAHTGASSSDRPCVPPAVSGHPSSLARAPIEFKILEGGDSSWRKGLLCRKPQR
jgi:hypothetical protein